MKLNSDIPAPVFRKTESSATVMRLFGVLVAVVVTFVSLKALADEPAEPVPHEALQSTVGEVPEQSAPLHVADADTLSTGPEVVEVVADPDTVWVDESSVGYLFESCPLSPLDILKKPMRQALVQRVLKGEEPGVLNSVYTVSEIDSLTDNYLKLKLTDVSTLTINKFTLKKKPVLMTVYTIGGKGRASDSDIEFFDDQWQPLETKKLFETPKVEDFLEVTKSDKKELKRIAELVPFPTFELTPAPDAKTITVSLTVGVFLSEEAKEELKPYVVPERVWVWAGKKFKMRK